MLPLHSRRHFLRDCGVGLGKIALAGLLTDALGSRAHAASAAHPLAPKPPHFPAKAKRVIHLFMAGAPSQLDLFDYKPELAKLEGKPLPPTLRSMADAEPYHQRPPLMLKPAVLTAMARLANKAADDAGREGIRTRLLGVPLSAMRI